MVEWKSPQVMQATFAFYVKLHYVITGIYIWELLTTLQLEYDVILTRKKFRWSFLCYFSNRYFYLANILTVLVFNNVSLTKPANCHGMFIGIMFTGNMALGLASANLAIRTIAIWRNNKNVTRTLGVCMLVYCALIIYQSTTVQAVWVAGVGCVPATTNFKWVVVLVAYALCLDGLVLGLNIYKLGFDPKSVLDRKQGRRKYGPLTHLVVTQGLAYFLIAFVVNLLGLISVILVLNVGVTAITGVICQVVTTIVACRAVRSLINHFYDDLDVVVSLESTRPRQTVQEHPRFRMSASPSGVTESKIDHSSLFIDANGGRTPTGDGDGHKQLLV